MRYVLFSPIGNTDPIRGCYDGAWLHICRVYQPRVCVAYLSRQMIEKEEVIEADGQRKDLYARTIGLLNAHLFGDDAARYIQLECVRDRDCEAAHSLEYFVPRFQNLLRGLHERFPDDEILVNMSSGTAGMKGTLLALCTLLPFKVTPIQVSDPAKGEGEKPPTVDKNYQVDLEFELDLDNDADFVSRASVQPLENLGLAMQINELCRLVEEGDYHTALREVMGESLKNRVSHKVRMAIIGAEARSCMKLETAGKAFQTSGFSMGNVLCKRAGEPDWLCAEYLLTMKNDLKSGAFDNFIRKLTPILTKLCELYLASIGKDVRQNGVNSDGRWVRNRIPQDWLDVLDNAFGYFEGKALSVANMKPLIAKFGRPEAAKLVEPLRKVEEKVRNELAHEIVPFGRPEIEKELRRSGQNSIKTPEDLLECLRAFFGIIWPGGPFDEAYWQGYEAMNAHICGLLKAENAAE